MKPWSQLAIALVASTLACTRPAPPPAPAVAEPSPAPTAVPPPAVASPVAVPAPATPAVVELEPKADAKFGYSVQLPKGAKELAKDDMAHTYSLVLPDGLSELNIHLTHNGEESLDSAVGTATMMGSKAVLEKKALDGNGFLVIKAPEGPLQEVWVFQKGKTMPLTAKCTGPSAQLAALKTICLSAQATK